MIVIITVALKPLAVARLCLGFDPDEQSVVRVAGAAVGAAELVNTVALHVG